MTTKKDIKEQFAKTSQAYLTSATHARDVDLDVILLLLEPHEKMSVLDIATGAGHTAVKIAPFVREVLATDLTEAMLDRVNELATKKQIANLKTMLADAEDLPFEDGAFDAVTCRIAPHHFLDIQKAMTEIGRVLKINSGVAVIEDSISPLDNGLDMFINTLERIRDRTHIRSYTLGEWHDLAAHGRLAVEETLIYRKRHDVADWIKRAAISLEEETQVLEMFASANAHARKYYEIVFDKGTPISFVDDKAMLKLRRF